MLILLAEPLMPSLMMAPPMRAIEAEAPIPPPTSPLTRWHFKADMTPSPHRLTAGHDVIFFCRPDGLIDQYSARYRPFTRCVICCRSTMKLGRQAMAFPPRHERL